MKNQKTKNEKAKRKIPDARRVHQGFCAWSCQCDSNARPHPYQGCALPTEL